MYNAGALAIATADMEPLPEEIRADALRALLGPLPSLLAMGGDDRLALHSSTKLNVYGCSPKPRSGVLSYSSCTATSISERAYDRALQARDTLVRESATRSLVETFDLHVQRMRRSLATCLRLNGTGTEIVFSPSGTDSQLHALFIARMTLGTPICNIVVASDQTGSGTAHTSWGRHFSSRTAQGGSVEKGSPIAGLADEVASIGISLFAPDGEVRSLDEIDAAVFGAVHSQITAGCKVVLQTMEASKLGWRAPSDSCLEAIRLAYPQSVQIVVDACQMRIGPARIKSYLDRGCIVLLTGSKFFTGPAFSGATLVPAALSDRLAAIGEAPDGLAEYATHADLPPRWSGLRSTLPVTPNFGQWLRWEAALEEIRAYYALPARYRLSVLTRVAKAVPKMIAGSRSLELLPNPLEGDAHDPEMPAQTIFPFLIRTGGGYRTHDEMTKIYHALNREVSNATGAEHALATTLCHIGQPVKLPASGGSATSVLRLALGARTVTETWSSDDTTVERNIRAVVNDIATVVQKIDFLAGTGAHFVETI